MRKTKQRKEKYKIQWHEYKAPLLLVLSFFFFFHENEEKMSSSSSSKFPLYLGF